MISGPAPQLFQISSAIASCRWVCTSLCSSMPSRASVVEHHARLLAHLRPAARRRAGPPARSRGRSPRARTRDPSPCSCATMIRTPSAESCRRSRSTASLRVAEREPVDELITPASTVAVAPHRAALELEHVAVLADEDPRRDRRPSPRPGARARRACGVSPWTGTNARAAEREHRLQLVGGAVARHVHGRDLLVEHRRARAGQRVHRVGHGELVPRDRLRRHDHGSPDWIATSGWSLNAMRVSAESGSPCEPVHRIVASRGGELVEPPGLDQQASSATSA